MKPSTYALGWFAGCLMACSATKSVEPSPGVRATDKPQNAGEPARYAMVDATILFTDCPKVSNYSATLAEKTMRRLVEGCSDVPSGQASFIATLMPGGRIVLSPAEAAAGTVPLCVLQHELSHQVNVRQACNMHVQMEQRQKP